MVEPGMEKSGPLMMTGQGGSFTNESGPKRGGSVLVNLLHDKTNHVMGFGGNEWR
jgi:hypothetical protein